MTFNPQQYNSLNNEEKTNISIKALNWYKEHKDHVKKIMQEEKKYSYSPSGSDMFRPELWKGAHWNWFNIMITLL
jgi:hypothetical protein